MHQRGDGDAGNQQPRRLQAARQPEDEHGDDERPARAREQQAAAAERGEGDEGGEYRQRHAGADAEHFRAGHRVVRQRLQQHARAGEEDANGNGAQAARQAVLKDDVALPVPAPAVRPGGKSL